MKCWKMFQCAYAQIHPKGESCFCEFYKEEKTKHECLKCKANEGEKHE